MTVNRTNVRRTLNPGPERCDRSVRLRMGAVTIVAGMCEPLQGHAFLRIRRSFEQANRRTNDHPPGIARFAPKWVAPEACTASGAIGRQLRFRKSGSEPDRTGLRPIFSTNVFDRRSTSFFQSAEPCSSGGVSNWSLKRSRLSWPAVFRRREHESHLPCRPFGSEPTQKAERPAAHRASRSAW